MNNQSLASRISAFLAFSLFLISSVSLMGCSSSGGSNANPSGYYDITGTATVKMDDDTTDLPISDLQAMVYNNRIMMISMANGLVYDGTMAISGDTFTANVKVYRNQVTIHSSVTITGNITEGSSITGTLTGTGEGNGTFSLTYALKNTQLATLARVFFGWNGPISGGGYADFAIYSGDIVDDGKQTNGPLNGCEMNGTISPVTNSELYTVNVTLTNCNDATASTAYTGLATLRDDTTTDDTLVYSITNGFFSFNGEFNNYPLL